LAIVQISRITNRKGLQENLPQLAGAELGWSTDTRRLFIGNGTLEDGAPIIGNTEILTEFSDIFAFQTNYTYEGLAAGYAVQTGPTPGAPISLSLQSWLDQFASVLDFGAVGDGITDDTDAINRALYQLFCRESNPQIRRSLFFPAGVYRVTESILIPPYATLYGEGRVNSVIQLADNADSTVAPFVARTTDSLQQTGVNIGNNGATTPGEVTILNMGFATATGTNADVFLIEDASHVNFFNVSFKGPLAQADLITDADDIAGVRFASTASLRSSQIVFDGCLFGGTTYGINTTTYNSNTTQAVNGVVVNNSIFDTLYQGIIVGINPVAVSGSGPNGFRITNNILNRIYAEGVLFGSYTSLNSTSQNMFYDVGNYFNGATSPATDVILITSPNNSCIGDMFLRSDANSQTWKRINYGSKSVIATTNGVELGLGTRHIKSGALTSLTGGVAVPTTIGTAGNYLTLDTTLSKCFTVNYTIVRGSAYRTGTLTIISEDGVNPLSYTDDYTENASTGIILQLSQSVNVISVQYTSGVGSPSAFSYDINYLTVVA
jgi:hypothetical protein